MLRYSRMDVKEFFEHACTEAALPKKESGHSFTGLLFLVLAHDFRAYVDLDFGPRSHEKRKEELAKVRKRDKSGNKSKKRKSRSNTWTLEKRQKAADTAKAAWRQRHEQYIAQQVSTIFKKMHAQEYAYIRRYCDSSMIPPYAELIKVCLSFLSNEEIQRGYTLAMQKRQFHDGVHPWRQEIEQAPSLLRNLHKIVKPHVSDNIETFDSWADQFDSLVTRVLHKLKERYRIHDVGSVANLELKSTVELDIPRPSLPKEDNENEGEKKEKQKEQKVKLESKVELHIPSTLNKDAENEEEEKKEEQKEQKVDTFKKAFYGMEGEFDWIPRHKRLLDDLLAQLDNVLKQM